MPFFRIFLLVLLPFFAISQIQYVDPLIGTDAHGHTFPGATLPFGMVQLSPDTRTDDSWDGCSGYHYSDSLIYGFSHTHLSGTGVPDYCDILLQPYAGKLTDNLADFASPYQRESQKAEAGFYSVFLEKPQTKVELTATPRVGIHRYTFGETWAADNLLLDLRHRDLVLDSDIEIISETEVAGRRVSRSWANEQHVYFVLRFSKPIASSILSSDGSFKGKRAKMAVGKAVFASFSFEKSDEPLVVTVGISATGRAGAMANLEAEAPHFDFEKYKTDAQDTWQKTLSKIEVKGGTEAEKRVFYTALYHAYLAPNIYNDVNGTYRGRDQKIHTLPRGQKGYYTVFSLWDTYRALHPLMTILEPERTNDFIRTFLLQYTQGGRLPIWELAACETDCMIGNHAIPVIADAWLKGIQGYDGELALEAMMSAANQERLGLGDYRSLGFIPSEKEAESVSKTLEYAFDDFAIAKMAENMEELGIADTFYRRSQQWRNLFDPSTGFLRARNNNAWHTPFDPTEVNFNYTEANAWQYRFAMPHDINAFMEKLGGESALEKALDGLFSASEQTSGRHQADITGLVGQYAQGNEPSHHIAYLYNYVGKPYKTQKLVHQIIESQYTDRPDGLCGNEDCGQMSAWLIFNALGFYPVVPVGGEYALGTPLFEEAILHLDNGATFKIEGNRRKKGDFYVQDVHLNAKAHPMSHLSHESIMAGGTLNFLLGNEPNEQFAAIEAHRPKAKVQAETPFVPVPFVANGDRVFEKKQKIALGCDEAAASLFYTIDGSEPTTDSKRYKKPFSIKKTSTVKAIAVLQGQSSPILTAQFDQLNKDLKVHAYHCEFSNQYTARGEGGLVDGLRGGADFRSGGWQGFEGQHFDLVLDLGKKGKTLSKIGLSALQDENSWIFFPKTVRFEGSNDAENWTHLGEAFPDFEPEEKGTLLQDFEVFFGLKTMKFRYIRIIGESLMVCPDTHKGAGYPCWVFVDEVWAE